MALRGLDTNLLFHLQALLEEGNMTRASRRAGLSQSGLSRALGRLRTHFGDPLFVATGRGLRPTPFARSLLEPLRQAMSGLEKIGEARAAFDPLQSQRTFRIASADYSTLLLLAPLQRRLATRAPGIDLAICPMNDGVFERLDLDMVIGQPVRGRPGRMAKVLYIEDFCVVARLNHPLLRGPLTWRRYASAAHVLVTPGGQPGSVMDELLAAVGLRRRIAITMPSFLTVPAFLADSDHIATLPRRLARTFAAERKLGLRDLPGKSPTFPVTLSFLQEHSLDPAHTFLRKLLVEVSRQSFDGLGA